MTGENYIPRSSINYTVHPIYFSFRYCVLGFQTCSHSQLASGTVNPFRSLIGPLEGISNKGRKA
jgi:hypothetical protein